tara:strand:+ start:719 stop:1018 length:300 start_codon:yes stop_codon:yes gene_type:complete
MARGENKVESYLHKRITQLGGTTRKWVSPGRDSVPDRIGFLPNNIIFFAEVKTMNGVLTVRQSREIETLKSYDCEVYVVYGTDGVDKLTEHLRTKHGIA